MAMVAGYAHSLLELEKRWTSVKNWSVATMSIILIGEGLIMIGVSGWPSS